MSSPQKPQSQSQSQQQPQQAKQTILTPVRLLEKLSTIDEAQQGNTPAPSMSMIMLITGIQSLGKNNVSAGQKLTKSLEEAEKNQKNQEEIAVSLLGLGYYHIIMNEHEKAIPLYIRSLGIWKQIRGETYIYLGDLITDIAKIYQILNNEVEYNKMMEQYKTLYQVNNKPIPTTTNK